MRGIQWSPVNSPHKGQWRGALIFSLICAWINCVNNREAGDLRRQRDHYDVIVMSCNHLTGTNLCSNGIKANDHGPLALQISLFRESGCERKYLLGAKNDIDVALLGDDAKAWMLWLAKYSFMAKHMASFAKSHDIIHYCSAAIWQYLLFGCLREELYFLFMQTYRAGHYPLT